MDERVLKRGLVGAGSLLLAVFCLAPFVYMLAVSLNPAQDLLAGGAGPGWTLGHYRDVLFHRSLRFPEYLLNSLAVSAVSAAGAVFLASLAAYALTRFSFAGKVAVLAFVLAVSMFPQISLAGYLFKLTAALGWINTLPALILPYIAWTLPLALWILVSYFAQIPTELDQAALIDGAGRTRILASIILPLAAPGIVSTLLLTFILAMNEFLFALVLTTDHHSRTVPVGIALFEGLHGQTPWGQIMAASALTAVPIVVLTLVFQKRMVQGLLHGAVKG